MPEVHVLEKLEELSQSVGRIEGFLKTLRCTEHGKIMNEFDTQLRGNGKDGVITRMDRLEQRAKFKDSILWLLIGGFLSSIGTVILIHIS